MMSRDMRAKAAWSWMFSVRWASCAVGLLLDPRPPEIDHGAGTLGRDLAGQLLAHQKRHGFVERRILAVGVAGDVLLAVAVVQHGREIGLHAGHGIGAQRLDAGLLDGLEHGAGVLALRLVVGVDLVVVVGEAQREAVGQPAHDGDVGGLQLIADLRQLRLVARKRRAARCRRPRRVPGPRQWSSSRR